MKIKKPNKNSLQNKVIDEQIDQLLEQNRRLSTHSKSVIEIYDIQKVKALFNRQSPRSPLTPFLEKMIQEGNLRSLQTVTKNVINNIENLVHKFPIFTDVIEYVAKNLTLISLSKPSIISIPPILLVGAPGIGKTRFLNELSEVLKLDFYQVDLASITSGFVLSGNSTSWADGKPGLVVEYLRSSKSANYIFMLDELDKASGDARYDPLGCLYTLLEKKSAKSFVDEALTTPMNCSYINWFASANYFESIPVPIRSRFVTFHIQEPSPEQQRLITHSVYEDILKDHLWGRKFTKTLSAEVVNKVAVQPARKQKATLIRACAEVAYHRDKTSKKLLEINAQDIHLLDAEATKRTIGFI